MGWYIVVKTIKGNRYRYRQLTWRDENGRVRCESHYLGRADAGGSLDNPKDKDDASPRPARDIAGERQLIDTIFNSATLIGVVRFPRKCSFAAVRARACARR